MITVNAGKYKDDPIYISPTHSGWQAALGHIAIGLVSWPVIKYCGHNNNCLIVKVTAVAVNVQNVTY